MTITGKDRAHDFGDPLVADAAVQNSRASSDRNEVPIYAWYGQLERVDLVLGPAPTCDLSPW